MKKVLLIKIEMVDTYSSMGMEAAFIDAFEEVHSINWQKIRFDNGRDGLTVLWQKIQNECLAFHPDLIFCQFQRDILTPEQFEWLSKYAFVINYSEDARADTSYEMVWHEAVAPFVGLSIFTNMDACRRFWDKGLRAAYMLVSYNHLWYRPQTKTDKNYGDIVFIGNNFSGTNLNFPLAEERKEMIAFMKEKFGDCFQAYGIGQENQVLKPMQVVEAYNNCKIAITHNHFKREGYMSDRGLNAMACGALTIHHHFEGIEEMFKAWPMKASWKTFEGLETLCDYYLQEYRRMDLMFDYKKEQPKYIKENHSWHNRVKFIKGFVEMEKFHKKVEEAKFTALIKQVDANDKSI